MIPIRSETPPIVITMIYSIQMLPFISEFCRWASKCILILLYYISEYTLLLFLLIAGVRHHHILLLCQHSRSTLSACLRRPPPLSNKNRIKTFNRFIHNRSHRSAGIIIILCVLKIGDWLFSALWHHTSTYRTWYK